MRLCLLVSPSYELPYWLSNAKFSPETIYTQTKKFNSTGFIYIVIYLCIQCNNDNNKEAINLKGEGLKEHYLGGAGIKKKESKVI